MSEVSRDKEKTEFRGSLSILMGRKINTGNYESAECSVWITRRYDDDEPDQIPDQELMRKEGKRILDRWEEEERNRRTPPKKKSSNPYRRRGV